jgi:hypothetical protein
MNFDVVVVLGMHRCGTSAVTKGLELFGVSLGENLMPANKYNPKGYFEDKQLVKINDKIFTKNGIDWKILQQLEPTDLKGVKHRAEQKLAKEFLEKRLSKCGPIGLKDPRMCRTLPLWQKIFAEMGVRVGYLMPFRYPSQVAASLLKRNKISLDYGMMLWASYQVDALSYTEGKPRLFVGYQQLLEKPEDELAGIAEFLETAWDPRNRLALEYVKEFLDKNLCHHQTNKVQNQDVAAAQVLAEALDAICQKNCKQDLLVLENAATEVPPAIIKYAISHKNQLKLTSSNFENVFRRKI